MRVRTSATCKSDVIDLDFMYIYDPPSLLHGYREMSPTVGEGLTFRAVALWVLNIANACRDTGPRFLYGFS